MTPAETESHQSAALEAIKELLEANVLEAEKSADDEGRFALGFRVTFDRSHSPTRLRVTCRVSRVTTDEIECSVAVPNQPHLPL